MSAPTDRRYAESHEWHKQDCDTVTIGITQHAVDELTDITYVDLPTQRQKISRPANGAISAGNRIRRKPLAELYSAISGEVLEANPALKDDPSLVNTDPYGKGWMLKVKAPGANLSALMTGQQYTEKHGG